jgi:hypothetical protein
MQHNKKKSVLILVEKVEAMRVLKVVANGTKMDFMRLLNDLD